MRAHPRRSWSIVVAGLAGAWALFLLPPQLIAWYDAPEWAIALNRSGFYRGVHRLVGGLGLHDDYLVFGAAISISMLLLWWSTGPVMAWLGWAGRLFSAILLLLAPLTFLSYLNHADSAPLRLLWGSEGLGLITLLFGYWPHGTVVGLALQACVLAAFAPREPSTRLGASASRTPRLSGHGSGR
jgi:hypothetical protein